MLTGAKKSFKIALSKEISKLSYTEQFEEKEGGHRKIRKRFSEHFTGRCSYADPVLSAARTTAAAG